MRSSHVTRAAVLMLALLMPLTAIRVTAASCCVDGCEQPCCERDVHNSTVRPVLPCCRTVAVTHVTTQPTPTTVEQDGSPFASPSIVVTPLGPTVRRTPPVSTLATRLIPAPPLYHRHCALLL
jgi:hypothetical protein